MKFGINTFLFTSPFTNNSTRLFPKFKAWGFDGVDNVCSHPGEPDAYRRESGGMCVSCIPITSKAMRAK
jgi:D-psicose/D-tagatose/L-ribulose 3-epimerase